MTTTELGRPDCLRLLAGRSWGRVAFIRRSLPDVQPLAYTLVGDCLVLHTGSEGLERTLDGQVVAFEVDDLDPLAGSGWSVVVTGLARWRLRPDDLARRDRCAPLRSVDGTAAVTVTPGEISGRRTD